MAKPDITIIVSAFNEEEAIATTLADLEQHLPTGCEILVIDGGNDRTGEIVRSQEEQFPGLRHVPHPEDRGKGHAIRTGIGLAKGRYLVQFDADGQFFAKDIAAVLAPMQAGQAEVVLGSRFLPQSEKDKEASWSRNIGNSVVSQWASLLFRHRMTDLLAGLKGWTAEAAQTINLQSDLFEYEAEIPTRALRRGLRVVDVPVSTRHREAGESKVPVLKTGLRILAATTLFRWQK